MSDSGKVITFGKHKGKAKPVLGWVIIDLTGGLVDGVYHDEATAAGSLVCWRERWPDRNIMMARLCGDDAVPHPNWLIADRIWMGNRGDDGEPLKPPAGWR